LPTSATKSIDTDYRARIAVELVHQTFAGHVGERFDARPAEGEPLELVLASCDFNQSPGARAWTDSSQRQPFSLLFHDAGATTFVAQQTFALHHAELGELDLFLVPLGPDDRGMRYEAVIT
jgi:hypothetical protein